MKALACSHCHAPLPAQTYHCQEFAACPACREMLRLEVFPAFWLRSMPPHTPQPARAQEAGCFNHPHQRAENFCSQCGRFICALCDMELGEQHLCPTCREQARQSASLEDLERQRLCYDVLALNLAVYPLLTVWMTIFSAPVALYLAIRHWNSPACIAGPTHIRAILAIMIASLELLTWTAGFFYIIS